METFSLLTPTHFCAHTPAGTLISSLSRPEQADQSPWRLSDHSDQPHEMPPAPRPRGCPRGGADPVLDPRSSPAPGTAARGNRRGRGPVTLLHLRGRWQPSERQLGRVPHSCHRVAHGSSLGPQPAPHRRDPPAAPSPRHRGTDELSRLQTPPEPRRLLSSVCACPPPLPPFGSRSHHRKGTPTAAALTGKSPDNVTQLETTPDAARTALQPQSCKYTFAAAAARWDQLPPGGARSLSRLGGQRTSVRAPSPAPSPRPGWRAQPGAPRVPPPAAAQRPRAPLGPLPAPGTHLRLLCPPAAHRDGARLPAAAGTSEGHGRPRTPLRRCPDGGARALTVGWPRPRSSAVPSDAASSARRSPGGGPAVGRT
ncbi:PREDICTED: proline-rich protein 2-like [Lepidothrix coronata]|uniref:Proline-rich protein 2-like n=1 Tax=Lepidothrix coronata TaxID=321398 RepID=A0A6J0HEB1_9PASS|nr:PREDICTED: proline-rich protein 2-like [Lepidothrix coronata]